MTFYTGSCTTANELLTAITNACTANGWALNQGILSKSGCYIQLSLSDSILYILGGNGQNGANITDTPSTPQQSLFYANLGGVTYPLTYHIHAIDKEVYLFVNYNVDSWSYIAFGQSPVTGLPGTGNWYAALYPLYYGSDDGTTPSLLFSQRRQGGVPSNTGQHISWFFHHGLDDYHWSLSGTRYGEVNNNAWDYKPSQAAATLTISPLLARQPNNWNGEAILLNISPSIYRPEGWRSIVGDLKHARYVRNNNYEDGQIIILGNEKWRVYSTLRKNTASPNGSTSDSGTYALAIRYEGD